MKIENSSVTTVFNHNSPIKLSPCLAAELIWYKNDGRSCGVRICVATATFVQSIFQPYSTRLNEFGIADVRMNHPHSCIAHRLAFVEQQMLNNESMPRKKKPRSA